MGRIILSTSNLMTGGPSVMRKTAFDKSNREFTNALRSNFRAAQEDYSPPLSARGSASNSDAESSVSSRLSVSSWTTMAGSDYYVPTIDWEYGGLAEEPSQYEITVKLFFLPGAAVADRPQFTKDAIDLVLKTLRVDSVDLMIVSFPGLSFDGTCEKRADRNNAQQGNAKDEIKSWSYMEQLYEQGIVRKLGVAEFGSAKLGNFISKVNIAPEVNQINIKDCCKVPESLKELARSHRIALLTHRDCTDILPQGTLREMLSHGAKGAGVLADPPYGREGMQGELTPQWVIKYTAVVRDRGVIENKGYFAAAALEA